MPVPRHLEEAAKRLEEASARIREARASTEAQGPYREWLEALTDYTDALSEVQRFANESVHEKLRRLAAQLEISRDFEDATAPHA